MRKLKSIICLVVLLVSSSSAFAGRASCDHGLRSMPSDSRGNDSSYPAGYSNSSEEDNRRREPGPDETEDRNPEENDARDPGSF